jgi:hypothetical protein
MIINNLQMTRSITSMNFIYHMCCKRDGTPIHNEYVYSILLDAYINRLILMGHYIKFINNKLTRAYVIDNIDIYIYRCTPTRISA